MNIHFIALSYVIDVAKYAKEEDYWHFHENRVGDFPKLRCQWMNNFRVISQVIIDFGHKTNRR